MKIFVYADSIFLIKQGNMLKNIFFYLLAIEMSVLTM